MQPRVVPFAQSHLEQVIELSLRAWEPVFDSVRDRLEPSVYHAFYPDWREVQRGDVMEACTSQEHDTWVAVVGDKAVLGQVGPALRTIGRGQAISKGEKRRAAMLRGGRPGGRQPAAKIVGRHVVRSREKQIGDAGALRSG